MNLDRENNGEFYTLFPKLREDRVRFFIYFRMTIEHFDEILNLIRPDITKKFTHYRRPIDPTERLVVTLSK